MRKHRKRKYTIKIKKEKTKSKRKENNIKAAMKPEIDNVLSRLMESPRLMKSPRYNPYKKDKSQKTEPIIILDPKTQFDGRESWRPDVDRGILKLYNVEKKRDYLKLELREEDIDGKEILRCTAQIISHINKYDFLSYIKSKHAKKHKGYGTNLLYLLAKARNDKIVHNDVDYSEITIRDFLPEIFKPFRILLHLSVTLWASNLLYESPQFTLFEPFYDKQISNVVNILYNHKNSEGDIEEYGEDLDEKDKDTRMADDVNELLEVMSISPSEIFSYV